LRWKNDLYSYLSVAFLWKTLSSVKKFHKTTYFQIMMSDFTISWNRPYFLSLNFYRHLTWDFLSLLCLSKKSHSLQISHNYGNSLLNNHWQINKTVFKKLNCCLVVFFGIASCRDFSCLISNFRCKLYTLGNKWINFPENFLIVPRVWLGNWKCLLAT